MRILQTQLQKGALTGTARVRAVELERVLGQAWVWV
jgi:hypothetical protein